MFYYFIPPCVLILISVLFREVISLKTIAVMDILVLINYAFMIVSLAKEKQYDRKYCIHYPSTAVGAFSSTIVLLIEAGFILFRYDNTVNVALVLTAITLIHVFIVKIVDDFSLKTIRHYEEKK